MDIQTRLTPISQLAWLSEVKESGPRLNPRWPIWTRHLVVRSGAALAHPECHPYCELSLHLQGRGVEFVERQQAVRRPGDLFLAGPAVPHWFQITRYPLVTIAVYFLPSLLCEMGPQRDGFALLRRFTSRQGLERRLIRPPPALRPRLVESFKQILHESTHSATPGAEIRLRTLLLDMLVQIMRWERRSGHDWKIDDRDPPKWQHVNSALHYLREHFAEPVYGRDVARAVGVSESRLKALFREALGVPWSRYIQGYRIQQAVALLGASDCNVTEAALAVGFESLSHFNATFRSFMGVSPSDYLKAQGRTKTAKVSPKNGSPARRN